MTAPTSTDSFLDVVRKSNLIPLARLDAVLRQVKPEHVATPQQVAGVFIKAGLLTQFQAQQLLQGKHRGFTVGKYKVLERLGSSAVGTLYLCEHTLMRRRVVVKVLPTVKASSPLQLGRFYREARASALLDHPNLVRCHDVACEGNLHYLVMDYVDGSSIEHIVAQTGPLSIARACHYIRQAAEGLQHAFEHGLIHRDVKPANLMVERTGVVKVLDLGLARFANDEQDLLTMKFGNQNALGTVDYMAPEQSEDSHKVDVRADVYSLGGTFYFALTGEPPFADGSPTDKLLAHQNRIPQPVNTRRPEVPRALAALVSRMLAKDPAQRFQTPGEVAAALEPWTREPIPAPDPGEMPRLCLAARQAGINPGPRLREASNDSIPISRDETPRRPLELPDMQSSQPEMTPVSPSKRPRKKRPAPPPKQGLRPWQLALLLGASVAVGVLVRMLVLR
jgi:serine/threonine protein kinase